MSDLRRSNRLIGGSTLAAVLTMATVWRFVIHPIKEQMYQAQQQGVVSSQDAPLTPTEEQRNLKTTRKIQLRKATQRGDWQAVSALLSQGIDINDDIGGITALTTAAKYGQTELIHKILAANANIETTDHFGNTALCYAARYGHKDALRVLLEHGAKRNITNGSGLTALDLAIIGRHKDVYRFLKVQGMTVNLCQAVCADDDVLVRKLLAQGADINATCSSGNPMASLKEDTGLIVMTGNFVAASNAIYFAAFLTQTPLETTLELGKWKDAEFLIAQGAKINQQDKSGWTPLMRAVSYSRVGAVKFLLQHAARTDIKANDGKDAFSVLIAKQSEQGKKILRMLREYAANTRKK